MWRKVPIPDKANKLAKIIWFISLALSIIQHICRQKILVVNANC